MPLYIFIPMMMLLVSLPASSVACDISTEKQISQLKELLTKDPLVLADNALQNNHVVFFGVAGYSVTIPGIDTEKCNIEKFQVHIIPGTSDVMCSNEHRQLILDAKSFLITTMIQPFRTTLKWFCSGGLNHGGNQEMLCSTNRLLVRL